MRALRRFLLGFALVCAAEGAGALALGAAGVWPWPASLALGAVGLVSAALLARAWREGRVA